MGGSSKQTIGYRYRYAFQWGLTFGPVDAVLRWVVGGREAFRGRITESTAVNISQLELWGGDSKEGGIDGTLTINMGASDQAPDAGLAEVMGTAQPGGRGKLIAWFKGVFGAMNPYPKKGEFLVERILEGWADGEPWYPEKAAIQLAEVALPMDISGWQYQVIPYHANPGTTNLTPPTSGWADGQAPFWSGGWKPADAPAGHTNWPMGQILWLKRDISIPSTWPLVMRIWAENGCVVFMDGVEVASVNKPNVQLPAGGLAEFTVPSGTHSLSIKAFDEEPTQGDTYFAVEFLKPAPILSMNPAHILYDSITDAREHGGQGEPREAINDASFRAAADKLYAESFGLCMMQGESESAEEFQERVLNLIGGSLTQSRVTGEYFLDLIRSDYTLADLPIVTDDSILEIEVETATPLEMINRVQVQWLDIDENQSRITSPVTSLGLVQAVGGVISKTYDHREIPTESLALRVAQRYLAAQPSAKYSLKVNRKLFASRKGQFFRLQSAREGLTDVVCVIGDIDYGEHDKGAITVKALPDVFGLPNASFSAPASAVGSGNSEPAAPAPDGLAFELPYVEVISTVTPERLATLAADVGYFGMVAQRPAPDAINFSLWTAANGAPIADIGQRDWCPRGVLSSDIGFDDTALVLTEIVDASRVRIGSWAMLGTEIVRIDSMTGLTVTVGRGCADTVPVKHLAGSVLWFAGDWLASDSIEYVGGDVVEGNAQTRSPGSTLPIDQAFTATAEMDDRFARPYPPGMLRVNGEIDPGAVVGAITVTGVHRDRVLQADQLIDTEMAAVGPEVGTTYTVRYYLNGSLDFTDSGLSTVSSTHTPTGAGQMRLEVESVRDALVSYQMHVREFAVGLVLQAEDGTTITTESGQPITME